MKKRDKIIYWIATIWMSFGMLSGGIMQLLHVKETVEGVIRLGYPSYFLTIIGIWKILGVIAVLIPKFPLVKEWAYAGFFFLMSGALFSHIANEDNFKENIGPALFIVLIGISWYFRPADKKIISVNQ
ncbi:MAG: DoxX family protein [Cytophagaceae bacterium]